MAAALLQPVLIFLALSNSILADQSSIYEALKSHGLPSGLLPKGVLNFTIDDGGRFEAHLDRPCIAKLESELHYDRIVSGTLSYGRIAALSGVFAQELFLWFPVKGIRVDVPSSGLIYFDVGVVFRQFSLSVFENPPDCLAIPPSPDDRHIRTVTQGGAREAGSF